MTDISSLKDFAPEPGRLLERLRITDLTVDGKSVARHEGRVVFLDRGLPGALVAARVSEVKKSLVLASVEEELEPSPHASPPWCPHYEDCGACLWQHFSLSEARVWKSNHIRETLLRIGKTGNIPVLPVLPSPLERAFRNKMSFAFGSSPEGRLQLGLRKQRDHALVEVRACGLQHPVGMDILEHVRRISVSLGLAARRYVADMHSSGRGSMAGYLRFLVIRTPAHPINGCPQILVECITGPEHARQADGKVRNLTNSEAVRLMGEELVKTFSLSGFIHTERRSAADLAQGEKIVFHLGQQYFWESFGDLLLAVPYNAFLQTNTGAAGLLYKSIAEEACLRSGDVLWDLYCGIGSAGLFLARHAGQLHGFEVQRDAVLAARENAARQGFAHCTFHEGDIGMCRTQEIPAPDVIIADPPRAGFAKNVIELLLQSPARKLLYVSCNAATQARDAALLSQRWLPVKSRPVDMFPYTPHVENLLVFERR